MKERKMEIIIKTHEVLIVGRQHCLSRSWCARCSRQVLTVSLHDVCASGLGLEAAQGRVDTGRMHLIDVDGTMPRVCLNSPVQI